jgi:hypothetical protein
MPKLFTNETVAGCSGGKLRNIIASLKNAAKITGRRVAEASTKVGGSLSSIKNFTSNVTGEIKNAGKSLFLLMNAFYLISFFYQFKAKMMSGRAGPFV